MFWPRSINGGDDLAGKVVVKNTGPYTADEVSVKSFLYLQYIVQLLSNIYQVVQVYVSWNTTLSSPNIQLVQFERVTIQKGMEVSLLFVIKPRSLSLWLDNDEGFVVPKGTINLYVGGQQPNQKKDVGSNILKTEIVIETSKVLPP